MFKQKDLEAGRHMVITRDESVYIVANSHSPIRRGGSYWNERLADWTGDGCSEFDW